MHVSSLFVLCIIFCSIVFSIWKKRFICYTIAIANLIIFFIIYILALLNDYSVYYELGFIPSTIFLPERVYTILTYMYIHATPLHIIMNMLILILIGAPFEDRVGSRNFSIIYYATGIMGIIIDGFFDISSNIPGVGASGAIFGIMGAFALLYPRDEIPMVLGIIFLERVPVFLAVIVAGVVEFAYVLSSTADNVGHFTHVASLVCGICIAKIVVREREKKIKKVNYEKLKEFCKDKKTEEVFEKIMKEEIEDVKLAWVEHFIELAKCPKCIGKLKLEKNKVFCDCGYELEL